MVGRGGRLTTGMQWADAFVGWIDAFAANSCVLCVRPPVWPTGAIMLLLCLLRARPRPQLRCVCFCEPAPTTPCVCFREPALRPQQHRVCHKNVHNCAPVGRAALLACGFACGPRPYKPKAKPHATAVRSVFRTCVRRACVPDAVLGVICSNVAVVHRQALLSVAAFSVWGCHMWCEGARAISRFARMPADVAVRRQWGRRAGSRKHTYGVVGAGSQKHTQHDALHCRIL